MERGGRRGCDGVVKPGVAGGVNAGEMIEGGGLEVRRCEAAVPVLEGLCAVPVPVPSWAALALSLSEVWKSKPCRLGLCGCGVYSGGSPGV
jgi:hypothetical protein